MTTPTPASQPSLWFDSAMDTGIVPASVLPSLEPRYMDMGLFSSGALNALLFNKTPGAATLISCIVPL